MQREIKFRYRYEQTCPTGEVQILTRIYTLDEIAEFAKPWPNLEKILSRDEYTGLKDKNGKEIYEGDCLGGIWEDCCIEYCDKCKSFELIAKELGCMSCLGDVKWWELVEDDGKIEVIGNIKELLK